MRLLRYLVPLLLVLIAWFLVREFVMNDKPTDIRSVKERIREQAQRFHWGVGVLALLIVVIIVVRFLVQAIKSF